MRHWWILFFCFLCIFSFLQSGLVIQVSKEIVVMFFEVLIPSLFFMMVLLKIMEESGLLATISQVGFGWMTYMFRANRSELPYILSGIFLGFAANAYLLKEAYQKKSISKESAQRLVYTIHAPTITFCIITCGVLLQDLRYGTLLFLIQTLVSLVFYRFCYSSVQTLPTQKNKPVFACIKDAMLSTGLGLYQMAGYMLFTSVMLSLFLYYTPVPLHLPIQAIVEFASSAIYICKAILPITNKLLLLSLVFGFGGFCGHLQVFTFADSIGLNYGKYYIIRVLQSAVSFLLMLGIIYIFL